MTRHPLIPEPARAPSREEEEEEEEEEEAKGAAQRGGRFLPGTVRAAVGSVSVHGPSLGL